MSYTFDEANHVHLYNGKKMYGVTSVLKSWGDASALLNWGVKQAVDHLKKNPDDFDGALVAHHKVRDAAGNKGTMVHKQLEDALNVWINTNTVTKTDDTVVDSVLEYLIKKAITPIASEMPVYDTKNWYAGIMDGLVELDGKTYVLDFKTSGTIQTKFWYQLGAYSYAYRAMTGLPVHGALIIHIPRGTNFNPKWGVYTHYNIAELEKGWLNIFETFKLDKELQEKAKFTVKKKSTNSDVVKS